MNKADLISEVTKVVSTKKEAQAAVNCVFACIPKAMKKGSPVTIAGFGSFKVAKRKARKGRNPKTGEAVALSGKYVPHFKPGKELRERVNNIMKSQD